MSSFHAVSWEHYIVTHLRGGVKDIVFFTMRLMFSLFSLRCFNVHCSPFTVFNYTLVRLQCFNVLQLNGPALPVKKIEFF